MPLGRRVAVWSYRAVLRLPVADQVPVAGSYSSALARESLRSCPPATSTLPSSSSVDVWWNRAVLRLPVYSHSKGVAAHVRMDASPAEKDSRRRITGRARLLK